ncbi:MAG TPA: phosphoglycerate kinase [Flavobacteriales bacterium]|nr:phosphoglycerate kinase [Flavobacteriales bacterium]HPH82538.1 phosphoglycerate kinase [Flavobacteriales bacterium]
MLSIETADFSGKKVLIRVDFNVPLDANLHVSDDTRIRAAIPTIQKVLAGGGAVILMSHLGRPKSGPEDKFSLKHICGKVSELVGKPVAFAADCIGPVAETAVGQLKMGEILLLENLRFYKEEEAGDVAFAQKLAALGDMYMNDAFGTAHRAHASTAVIAQFFSVQKLFGYVMQGEIDAIDRVLQHPVHPVLAIMGGAKVSSKISIIENVLPKVNHLIIGGGMTFTFIKAMGGQIGSSLVEDEQLNLALELLEKAKAMGVQIHLPVDAVIADKFAADANTQTTDVNVIPAGWMGLDIGPKTIAQFSEVIRSCKTILWNGPMGVFEMPAFEKGTREVAMAIVAATEAGSFSLVGGGDSVAAVNQFGIAERVSYVSTGGGALLEYMEGIELPGVAAIRG